MKNLNPLSGLKQIRRGYLCFPRKFLLEIIREKKLTPTELTYFLIFLVSADWDSQTHRKGFVRHSLKKLAEIWQLPNSTLYENLKRLINKGVIVIELKTPKIKNFDDFTYSGANQLAKQNYSNEELKKYFSNLFLDSEKSEKTETGRADSFKSSFKGEFNVLSNQFPKKVLLKQEIRGKEDYQMLYEKELSSKLTPDLMQWIDENITSEVSVANKEEEEKIIETYFNGNWKKYQDNLIRD